VDPGPPPGGLIGVSISLPEPWRGHLTAWRAKAGDPLADLVVPHVTLLGPTAVADEDRPEIHAHLSRVAAAHRPFDMELRGTGTFQPVSPVVFVAIAEGISACEQLEAAVRAGPLHRELRFPYHPHITVAQEVTAEQLNVAYMGLADFVARFKVDSFAAFEQDGAGHWHPLHRYRLGKPVPRARARRTRSESAGG
jgi:2'-5' RNA ligase